MFRRDRQGGDARRCRPVDSNGKSARQRRTARGGRPGGCWTFDGRDSESDELEPIREELHTQGWSPSSSRLAWGASLDSLPRAVERGLRPKPRNGLPPWRRGQRPRRSRRSCPERLLLRSRDVIEKLPPKFEQARLFSELATAQAELTFHKAARETGHRAVETVLAMNIEEEQNPTNFARKNQRARQAAKAPGRRYLEAALAAEEKIGVASPVARSYREFVLQEVGEAARGLSRRGEACHQPDATKGRNSGFVEWRRSRPKRRRATSRATERSIQSPTTCSMWRRSSG